MDASIAEKLAIYLYNMFILKLNFQGKGHSLANCLYCTLIISQKCLAFLFLTRGMRIFFAILTGIGNRRFTSQKIGHSCLKNVYFES